MHCMTDHRIQNNPSSSFENKHKASQILAMWYSLHILQYMGSL